MNRWLLLLGTIPIAMYACGGGDQGNDGGPGDSTAQDSPAADAALDGGQPSDADAHVPVLDACVAIEGGLACDPAHVTCGTTQCTAGSAFCCIEREGGMMPFTCDTTVMQCQMGMTQGTVAYCDEAANCADAEVCCGFIGGNGGYATSCQPSCEGNAVQFCHGSAECASGTCVGQTCNGEYVETCGALVECPP